MTTTIHCAGCAAEKQVKPTAAGPGRLPRGWHRSNEQTHCDACWSRKYVLRAVTFCVASPVDGDWPTLRQVLAEQWTQFTSAANWMVSECYVRDAKRLPGLEKCPPMPAIYLYPEARARFPSLPSQSVAALEQAVKRRYAAARWKVIWTGEASIPTYRYPAPAIAPNKGWTAGYDETGERPQVSVRLGERRVTLRLKGGQRYRRQLGHFRDIVSGAAVQGELAIFRRRAGESRLDQGQQRERENGARVSFDIFVKLVAWLPRKPRGERSGVLYVRTDKDSLLLALDAKDERIWYLHADHVRRWQAEHRRWLNRWSDDRKAEQRPDATFAARRSAAVVKHRRRIEAFLKQAAAQLAGFAARRNFAEVRYNDAERGYCAEFPWYALAEKLRNKLDESCITFTPASGEVTAEPPGPLAEAQDDDG